MKEKHFPTILGIIFLVVILFVGVYLSLRKTSFFSKASNTCEPINGQITNLTYGSFDFSFTTPTSCTATLVINNKIYQDSSSVSNTHYFKISNLSPATSYQFHLISGGITYSKPEYTFTTASKPSSSIPTSNLAWGKVIDQDSKPISGAIVYLTIPGSQSLSAFSNKDGNWNISFATSFNTNKTDWFIPSDPIDEDIIVYSPDGKLTQITNSTDNNDPVPDIIIGQNYFSTSPVPTTSENLLGSGIGITASSVALSISSPNESETISTLRPDIFGKGPASATFQLNLDGSYTNVTIGSDNTWHWSPQKDLSYGAHKITIIYQGKTITRSFTVATISSLAFTSSSSAIKTPPSPTLFPTSLPTSIPTIVPTTVPTTIRAAKISTTSALYQSGESFPTLFLTISALILFSFSFYYFRR